MSAEQDRLEQEALLVEYQAAQDSAQHHDNLIWAISSVMWGASLILLGFILTTDPSRGSAALITIIAALGLVLTANVWITTFQLRALKNHKYQRCKEIEDQIETLRQHSTVQYVRGSQSFMYSLVMIVLLAAWFAVLIRAWS